MIINTRDQKAIRRELGARIREARTRIGLTQAELGERLGVGQVSIAQYEAGSVDVSYSKLYLLAAVLGVNLAWLASGEESDQNINTAQILRRLADRIDAMRHHIYSSPGRSPQMASSELLAEELVAYITACDLSEITVPESE